MKHILLAALLFLTLSLVFRAEAQDTKKILSDVTIAYGNGWKDVKSIRMHYVGHTHWLEQSENPNGPFITGYEDVNEIRVLSAQKLVQDVESKIFQFNKATRHVNVLNDTIGYMQYGERKFPMGYQSIKQQEQWILCGPEQLLERARKNTLRYEGEEMVEGIAQHKISFIESGLKRTLFINKKTNLISEAHIETFLPHEFFYSVWGKFTTRVQYTLYSLNQGNLLYPMQWDVYRIGQLWKKITINDIQFNRNVPDSLFIVDAPAKPMNKQTAQQTVLNVSQAIEVAKGIFVIPGNWFTGWVEHEDGIVVMEAPISSGYSTQLISEIKKRYRNKKIKGIVVSSDAWPHLGGAREYFSKEIPVYTNALNEQILSRLANSDYSPLPDNHHVKKNKPQLQLVSKPTTIPDKTSPMVIYPIEGEGGERMVAVYFPNQKVLYASDLIQKQGKEFFFPEYLAEVEALVKRHNLAVETVYAMHTKPLPWKEVADALAEIRRNLNSATIDSLEK
jgi:hypothetical protein